MFMYKFLKDIYIKKRTVLKGVPTYETDAARFDFFFSISCTCSMCTRKEAKSELDYDQTKKMIVDILKPTKVRKPFKMC